MIIIPPRIHPSRARLSPEQYERIEREAAGQANAVGFMVAAILALLLDAIVLYLCVTGGFDPVARWVLIGSIPIIALGVVGFLHMRDQDRKDAERGGGQ